MRDYVTKFHTHTLNYHNIIVYSMHEQMVSSVHLDTAPELLVVEDGVR